jgi:hypothetical protein
MNAIMNATLPSSSLLQFQSKPQPMMPSSQFTSSSSKESKHFNPITSIAIRPISGAASLNIPKKPMRPLTGYHLFFQIEREYIIQTMAGEDSDASMHDKKVYLEDVPERYRNIKLSPDWYFGPGKKQKRKHRKSHGKVGFLELSRMISSRWANLEATDPNVKKFVQRIAKQELAEYLEDMKEYKEITKGLKPAAVSPSTSPSSSPAPSSRATAQPPVVSRESSFEQQSYDQSAEEEMMPPPPCRQVNTMMPPLPDMAMSNMMQGNYQSNRPIDLSDEIDYFISQIDDDARQTTLPSSNNQLKRRMSTAGSYHQEPSCSSNEDSLLSLLGPLFDTSELEADNIISQPVAKKQRRNSPSSVTVDIDDNEIIRLWKENN